MRSSHEQVCDLKEEIRMEKMILEFLAHSFSLVTQSIKSIRRPVQVKGSYNNILEIIHPPVAAGVHWPPQWWKDDW